MGNSAFTDKGQRSVSHSREKTASGQIPTSGLSESTSKLDKNNVSVMSAKRKPLATSTPHRILNSLKRNNKNPEQSMTKASSKKSLDELSQNTQDCNNVVVQQQQLEVSTFYYKNDELGID